MIVATIAVYNSVESIRACINSLCGKVDKILCFDGRWLGFEYPSKYSDDSTDYLINCLKEDLSVPIEYIQLPADIPQNVFRTAMVGYIQEGDWIFNIDADEYVVEFPDFINVILRETQERGFRVKMRNVVAPTFRLVKKTKGLSFSNDHRRVFDDAGELDLLHFPVLQSVVIDHQKISEKKRMRPYMSKYKEWLYEWEQQHIV